MLFSAAALVAARLEGVSPVSVMQGGGYEHRRRGKEAQARRLALYIANVGGRCPVHALSTVTGMCRKTIRQHLAASEDARDSMDLDALLEAFEALMAVGAGVHAPRPRGRAVAPRAAA